MANITITVPDDMVARVEEALRYPYDNMDGFYPVVIKGIKYQTNPLEGKTPSQAMKFCISTLIKEELGKYEGLEAGKDAAQKAVDDSAGIT